MEETLFTIKDIAQRLDLPESTLRKYRDAYMDYIPYVGSGRNKKYQENAIDVFVTIRDCRESRHLSWEDTEEELKEKFSVTDRVRAAEKRAVIQADDAVGLVDRLEEILEHMKNGSERQEFTMTALANELMRFSSAIERVSKIEKDISEFRRLIYSYNEVAQRQMKNALAGQDAVSGMMEKLTKRLGSIENALAYFPRYIDSKFEEVEKKNIAAKAEEKKAEREEKKAPASQEADGTMKLREELLATRIEMGKYKTLYEKIKKDNESLKEKMEADQGIAEQLSAPVGKKLEQMMNPGPRGGTLTVRGKKK